MTPDQAWKLVGELDEMFKAIHDGKAEAGATWIESAGVKYLIRVSRATEQPVQTE